MHEGQRYGWNRVWHPRGTDFDLSPDGFVAKPFRSRWGIESNTNLATLSLLEDKPCVVLLGEPGLGKSVALESEYDRLKEHGNLCLFAPLDSKELEANIFGNSAFQTWLQSGGDESHFSLLLDGLDYARQFDATIGQSLRNRLQSVMRPRLRLRITCRASEWLPSLEADLRRLWTADESVFVYHLVPLSAEDVRVACVEEGIDSAGFLTEVERVGASSLASSPITLRLLFDLFRQNQALPSSRWEVYERGCRLLCDEVNPLWHEGRTRRSMPDERYAVACRMAFLGVFANAKEIRNTPEPSSLSDTALRSEDIIGTPDEEIAQGARFAVTSQVFDETLNTGLFRPLGGGTFKLAHQTYGEFLAARYLFKREVPVEQLRSLFGNPIGDSGMPQQLTTTAAWLAIRHDVFRNWVVDFDPTVMLRGDLTSLSEKERNRLIDRLLEAASKDRFSSWDVRYGTILRNLNHPALGTQLKPWLRNSKNSENARTLAVSIAEACHVNEVLPYLANISLNGSEPKQLRIAAAYAIAEYGDAKTRERMRALLPVIDSDPEEQLRGIALKTFGAHLAVEI